MKVAVCDDNREFCEKERTTIKDVFKQYFQGEDCQVDIYNDGQTIISLSLIHISEPTRH